MMHRFLTTALLAAMLCSLSAVPASAQEFPSKTVFIVVPFPPGGSTDVLARALAAELGKAWHQSVVVENAPGAGSIIGAEKVTHAAPDGQTLLMTIDPTVVSNRFVYKKLPYDPDKSLAPITMVARGGLFIIANPSFPANNLHELVEAARRDPGKIAYASAGIGTQTNLMMEMLAQHEGVKFLHVPYKGGVTPDMTAVMSDQVQVTAASVAAAGSLVKAGKLKALAISGQKRSALFPNVPTIAESGYPYVDYTIWFGLFAPGGTSPQLVDRINHDVTSIVMRPDFTKKYITTMGLEPVADTPAEFAAAIRANVKVAAEMVKAAGVRPH